MAFSVMLAILCVCIVRGPLTLLLVEGGRPRAAYYSFLLLPTGSLATGLSLHLLAIFGGEMRVAVSLCAAATAGMVASWLVYWGARKHVQTEDSEVEEVEGPVEDADRNREREAVQRAGARPRERRRPIIKTRDKKTVISIPYFMIRLSDETFLFKPADRFELLKLSIKMRTNKKSSEKVLLFGKAVKDTKSKYIQEPELPGSQIKVSTRRDFKLPIKMPTLAGFKNKFMSVFRPDENQKPIIAKPSHTFPDIPNLESISSRIDRDKKKESEQTAPEIDQLGRQLEKADPDKDTCIICCNAKACCSFMPCLHGGLCFSCAKTAFSERQNCPFCNCKSVAVTELVDTELPTMYRSTSIYLLPVPTTC